MSDTGLKKARTLTDKGFYYDNLEKMSTCCREESNEEALVTAFVLHGVFKRLAEEIGDGPVIVNELRKLESRYRTAINLSLEKAASGASPEDQMKILSKLIALIWNPEG